MGVLMYFVNSYFDTGQAELCCVQHRRMINVLYYYYDEIFQVFGHFQYRAKSVAEPSKNISKPDEDDHHADFQDFIERH